MPELPDLTLYLEALTARVQGRRLLGIELLNPFLLRSVTPVPAAFAGATVHSLRRLGKRIALGCDGDRWLVLHLMVAGRLAWAERAPRGRSRAVLARFHFESGVLTLTEAGSKRRASLHLVEGTTALAGHDPGGLEPLCTTPAEFAARLTERNHTLKRALTDPRVLAGIGNAYSDEILHAARLSPFARTAQLETGELARLHGVAVEVLERWIGRLRAAAGAAFPRRVTAFRPDMAVHGRYGLPCPVCGAPVQRVRYADHEMNYCAGCQTGGRLYADRALSRLLKDDWPRSLDELEAAGP